MWVGVLAGELDGDAAEPGDVVEVQAASKKAIAKPDRMLTT